MPTSFVSSKKDSPITEEQIKEIKSRFGNLHYRSVIGALLHVSCCTRPDITYAVNKLAKFSHNPGIIIIHYRALIHLIDFIKTTSYKGLKYYSDYTNSSAYKLLTSNNIKTTEESIITFSDSSGNDCVDTGRSIGGYISFSQGGPNDYGSH